MSTSTIAERLMTAEEYSRFDDGGRITELVRGRIVEMSPPKPRHGMICVTIVSLLKQYVDAHRSGHVFSNDSGVITERDPDTVRGADVAYYSFERLPVDADLNEYPSAPPELIFEVKSPTDRWADITAKAAEYLNRGVDAVCIVDPERRVVVRHTPDAPPQNLSAEESLEFPHLLPGFLVKVGDLLA